MIGTRIFLGILAIIPFARARSSMAFQPPARPANFFTSGISMPKSTSIKVNTPDQIAIKFIEDTLGLAAADLAIKSIVPTVATGVTSVYLRQRVNGIEVANANINVNVNKAGMVISYGENIFRQMHPKQYALSKESILSSLSTTSEQSFDSLIDFLKLSKADQPWKIREGKEPMEEAVGNSRPVHYISKIGEIRADVPVFISYLQIDYDSKLELVYSYHVRLQDNWYDAYVSIETKKVEAIIDWVADGAKYNVLPISAVDIQQDKRKMIREPLDKRASPYGWRSNGRRSYLDTRGNNVWAQQNTFSVTDYQNLYRPTGDYRRIFDFPFNSKSEPKRNRDASITQLFYINNVLHDILYHYGFDEVSGNFQDNNGAKGGQGGDFVYANALVETNTENADFGTPPDGENGEMRMFLWYKTSPARDGVFDVAIVIHEYGHGLSNRLTGGPKNTGCLSTLESGGMGEGWSDVLAVVLEQEPSNKRTDIVPMGIYANGAGFRKYPYSTNFSINPSVYSYISLPSYAEVHLIGEVWAVTLLEVYWNIVDLLGFTRDLYSTSLRKGNTLFLQLMINAMKLQPCNPTFIQARDAFLQAEELLTNGTYKCVIWTGFSKRGLGHNARKVDNEARDDFQKPPTCN